MFLVWRYIMSVLLGFFIVLMVGLIIYISKMFFSKGKVYLLLSFCLQLFALTVALAAFIQNVNSTNLAEFIYIIFGIVTPIGFIAFEKIDYKVIKEVTIKSQKLFSQLTNFIVQKYKKMFKTKKNGNLEETSDNINNIDILNSISPSDHNGYFDLGKDLIEKGQYSDANQCFLRCIELVNNWEKAYFYLALTEEFLENNNNAILAYNKAISLKTDYIEAYCNLGNLLFRMGKSEEAISLFKMALNKNPLNYMLLFSFGVGLEKIGRYPEAAKSFSMALEQNPYDKDASYHLGAILTELRKYNEAIMVYKSALDVKPADYELFYNLSVVYSLLQKPDIAIDNLRKAIELNYKIKNDAKNNDAFKNIKTYPEFKKLVGI